MAMLRGRMRSGLSKILRSADALSSTSAFPLRPAFATVPELSRNYAAASGQVEKKVRVPLALFGGTGNYATSLFIAAKRSNAVNKVESEIFDIVEASKRSTMFYQFTKDLSVPADTRVKAIKEISAEAKLSDFTKNFLGHIEEIAKRYLELSMADRG